MDAFDLPRPSAAELTDIAEMRARLVEAEETLEALRNGHVDALVITGTDGTQNTFSLKGAEYPYRVMIEAMHEGAVTLAADGSILYCNQHFASMAGVALDKILARPIREFFAESEHEALDRLLHGLEYRNHEIEIRSADGSLRTVYLSANPLAIEGQPGAVYLLAMDLTAQKASENARREADQKYLAILESVTDALFTLDLGWRFTYVNDEAERMFGRKREELIGHVKWEVFPHLVGSEFDREFRLAAQRGRTADFEARLGDPPIWVEVHAYPSPIGLTVSLRDVTERHEAREQLGLLETCVAWMNDVVIITEAGEGGDCGVIVFVNDAFTRCTGYSRDEVMGRSPRMLQGELTQRPELDRIAAALRELQPVRAELINYRKGGEAYWNELDIVPVRSAAGPATHWIAVERDTTERRAAQQSLRLLNETLEVKVGQRTAELEIAYGTLASKEEEIRSVVEHMADGVVTFDDAGVIRSANPKIAAIFGYEPAAVIGRSILLLMPTLDSPAPSTESTFDAEASLGTGHDSLSTAGVHQNGTALALDVAISEYHIGGQRFWTAILRDIGERVRNLADLELAREGAEQASRAKSAFVATMSHEIRTPMNGVIGMIDVLEQTELAPDQAKMLGLARDSAYSLMNIIDDILDFSKIEAGKVELEREPISVPQLVEKVCSLVSSAAGNHGIALTTSISPASPASVWGDAGRLRQILVNLVNNAIKFSSGRDVAARVNVALSVRESSADRVTIELVVEDNGIGMDEATVDRLFKSFSQADATTRRRFGGTGLGLAISKHLVELMGGEILVDSTPEVGSTFTMRLPFELAPLPLEPAPEADVRVRAAGGKVLRRTDAVSRPELIIVAEDNHINRLVIQEQLTLLGFTAELAGNGREALALWRSGRFAALLTDLQMPEMDGYDLAASIRGEELEGARIPIVALTANALKDEAQRCKAAGMDDYLTKPVQLVKLEATLDRCLRRQAPTTDDGGPPAPEADRFTVAAAADAPRAFADGIVDAAVLPGLIGSDPAQLREFFLDFARNLGENGRLLGLAAAEFRHDDAGALAHTMKSTARAVGAHGLGEICAEIEIAAAGADGPALQRWCVRFGAEAAQVQAWIRAHAEAAATPA